MHVTADRSIHYTGYSIITTDDIRYPLEPKFKNIEIMVGQTCEESFETKDIEDWEMCVVVVEGMDILDMCSEEEHHPENCGPATESCSRDVFIQNIEFGKVTDRSSLPSRATNLCVIDIQTNHGVIKFVLYNKHPDDSCTHTVQFTFNDYSYSADL